MTSWRYGASIPRADPLCSTTPTPPVPSSMRPDADAVEDALDERLLRGDHVPFELAPASEGAHDRRPPGLPIEPVETEDVGEERGDVGLEPIEHRERVLAKREKHVHPQWAVDDRGE